MNRLIFTILLAAFSASAAAEWVRVADGEGETVYVDPATIRKTGHIVKIWYLRDFKTLQTQVGLSPFLSSKDQSEYDCKKERYRTLYFTNHTGNMGAGTTSYISAAPERDWKPVAPESLRKAVWKFACGKM